MTEIANFQTQPHGAEVATIIETADQIVEVLRHSDGTYDLTVHSRVSDTDRWDDCTARLSPRHFAVLGSIATMGGPCTCGAPDTGRWANKHTADCASLGVS